MIKEFNQDLPIKDCITITPEVLKTIQMLYKQRSPALAREFAIAALEYGFTGDIVTDNDELKALIKDTMFVANI